MSLVRSDFAQSPSDGPLRSFDQINLAQHLLVLVGREWGQWQDAEVRAFRHQSALDERPRFLLPILLDPTVRVPPSLLSYKTVELTVGISDAVRAIEAIVGDGPALA